MAIAINFPHGKPLAAVANMPREEWLALRHSGIGGSDAAAILGLDKYRSALACYADKIGELPEQPDNTAMRLGRELENTVAQLWAEQTGKKVRRCGYMYRSKQRDWQLANIDRCVIGESAGLECKTTSSFPVLRKCKGGEYPDRYYCQCMHYMAVTGAERWYLAILSLVDKQLYTYVIERDEEEIEALNAAELDFWQNVQDGTPPPPDGSKSAGEALALLYAHGDNDVDEVDLTENIDSISKLIDIKSEIKRLEALSDELQQQLCAKIGNAECGTDGHYRVSWKSFSRSGGIDSKKLAANYPDAFAACKKPDTHYRKFEVKEIM